jgi:hypothetical protein
VTETVYQGNTSRGGRIRDLTPDIMILPSFTGEGEYKVADEYCSCPHHRNKGERCKHITTRAAILENRKRRGYLPSQDAKVLELCVKLYGAVWPETYTVAYEVAGSSFSSWELRRIAWQRHQAKLGKAA